jgi:hypothetical protein
LRCIAEKKEDEHKSWYKNQQYLKNHLMPTALTLQMALLPYHKTRGLVDAVASMKEARNIGVRALNNFFWPLPRRRLTGIT